MEKYDIDVFHVILEGFISRTYSIEANSKEEAIAKIQSLVDNIDYDTLKELEINEEVVIEEAELLEIKSQD